MGLVHAHQHPIPCVPCDQHERAPGNPGCLEDLHKKVKDLYPENFEGARLTVRKVLSESFNVSHAFTLSSVTPSGYKFGASYVGTKPVGPLERYPIAIGEITPNGTTTATLMHTLGCRFRVKLNAQIAGSKYKSCSSTVEYRSDDFTLSLKLDNPSILKGQGTLVLHFLQAITSRWSLGAEVAHQRSLRIPLGRQTIMSMALRYSTGPSTLSATIGEAGVHVCYHRRTSQQVQLGTELEVNVRTHESLGTIVGQLDLPEVDLQMRGIINSECTVGAVFQKRLHPIPESTLVVSLMLNHLKQKFRVGIGLNIG